MENKSKNIVTDDFADTFYSYQKGELSNEEKEAFERQLAEDKLKRMAAEGLAAISYDDFIQSKLKFIPSVHQQNQRNGKLVKLIYAVTAIAAIFIFGLIINTVFVSKDTAPVNNPLTADALTDTLNANPISFGSSIKKNSAAADTTVIYPLGGYQNFDKYVNNRLSEIPGNHLFPDAIVVEIVFLPNGHVDTVWVTKGINEAVDLKITDIIKNGPIWKISRQNNRVINNRTERKIYLKPN